MTTIPTNDQARSSEYIAPLLFKIGTIGSLTNVGGSKFTESGNSPKNPKASSAL